MTEHWISSKIIATKNLFSSYNGLKAINANVIAVGLELKELTMIKMKSSIYMYS